MKLSLFSAAILALTLSVASGHQHAFAANHRSSAETDASPMYQSSRLIKVSEAAAPRWMDLADILVLRRAGVRFMDITDSQALHGSTLGGASLWSTKLPTELAKQKEVGAALEELSTDLYTKVLVPFTKFHNRYYDSKNGKESSEWLQKQIVALVEDSEAKANVTAFKHRFPQSSVVLRIEGQGENKDELVVLSAHQDSVNQFLPWFGRASGADDDGSGTVTILESLRVLLKQGFAPSRSVEFHWYAGEEGGLLGSQDIALDYKQRAQKVVANLHFDMTGFWKKGSQEVIGLVADRTDAETRALVKKLAESYTRLKTREFSCGYGCSDHSSWNQAGYRSAMAFESDELEANTHIHTPGDTVETLDLNHMLEFSKLAVAFAYEVGDAKSN
ncbi:hypothetical protein GGI25_003149 [Coemansia spiralis]|uniref:Peptide hydrolase n=2 Tax=Coemansia TaxID=4863 RepID=A0A9W8G7P7_9FUNG|nr:hypothetical protein BX070DRAFT_255080 [Coemansia spiralis]KAJ1991736.1 hypothetical protein EDC05_003233 [Coemansia umbellata]KAJ2621759.1 hypothetical protein GGI26_003854 [Coemansia sp. RSA 1358]KAJ2677514.1 hypothetical protein GGI25_003149 [Coemansia spiralis]